MVIVERGGTLLHMFNISKQNNSVSSVIFEGFSDMAWVMAHTSSCLESTGMSASPVGGND